MATTIQYHAVHGTAGVTPPCHEFSVPRKALLQFTTVDGDALEITMDDEVWEFVLETVARMHAKQLWNLR